MSQRPTCHPSVLAAMLAAAPERFVRRLEKNPALDWPWTLQAGVWHIAGGSEATVRLEVETGPVVREDQIQCSCLISPRCFHRLAVAAALAVAELAEAPAPPPSSEVEPAASSERLKDSAIGAARAVSLVCREVFLTGLLHCGAALRTKLAVCAHLAAGEGLPRISTLAMAVVNRLHDAAAKKAVERDRLASDFAQLCLLCERTADPAAPAALAGSFRRTFYPAGNLELTGVGCEPVCRASGETGAVLWMCDASGRLLHFSSVRPGNPLTPESAARSPLEIGQLHEAPRQLARTGLHLQNATCSSDGRLGMGGTVRAVGRPVTRWEDQPVAGLFARPLVAQVRQAISSLLRPEAHPAGDDLLFFKGTILGLHQRALLVDAGLRLPVHARAKADQPEAGNAVRSLGSAAGQRAAFIGRLLPVFAPTVELLAVGGFPGFPEAWQGRCFLGLDALSAGHLGCAGIDPVESGFPELPEAPFDEAHQRLVQLALSGQEFFSPGLEAGWGASIGKLEKAMAKNAARRLREVAFCPPIRRWSAWMEAWVLLEAAGLHFQAHLWEGPDEP